VPSAPTALTATPGNTTVALSWTAPANGGSTITGYNVYEAMISTGENYSAPVNGATLISGTSESVTHLINATTYYFTVEAVNAVGSSTASGETWAIPVASVPGAPTQVSATPGNASANVTWVAPSSSGSSAITGYTAAAADSTTATRGGETCTTSGALSCTVSGLTNGDTYTFTVKATNPSGSSPASSISNSVVPVVTVPSTPTGFKVAPGNTTIALSWTAPANGGSTIAGYNVYEARTSAGENYASPVNGTTLIAGTSMSVNGLTNADRYYFTVKAVNAVGSSAASSEVWAIPGVTVPSVPMSVRATRGANGSAQIAWTAPLNSGDSAISGYVVTPYVGSKAGTSHTFNSTATAATITGLIPGTSYSFAVAARNASGAGAPSAKSNVVSFPKAATKTTLALSVAKVTYGHEQVEHVSVTVARQSSGTTPTGTVTISGTLCRIKLASGKGSCTLSAKRFSVGSHSIVATYSGSAEYVGSASAKKTLTVVR
jgi:hypothetical protein